MEYNPVQKTLRYPIIDGALIIHNVLFTFSKIPINNDKHENTCFVNFPVFNLPYICICSHSLWTPPSWHSLDYYIGGCKYNHFPLFVRHRLEWVREWVREYVVVFPFCWKEEETTQHWDAISATFHLKFSP